MEYIIVSIAFTLLLSIVISNTLSMFVSAYSTIFTILITTICTTIYTKFPDSIMSHAIIITATMAIWMIGINIFVSFNNDATHKPQYRAIIHQCRRLSHYTTYPMCIIHLSAICLTLAAIAHYHTPQDQTQTILTIWTIWLTLSILIAQQHNQQYNTEYAKI